MDYVKEITYLFDKVIEILSTQTQMMTMIKDLRSEVQFLKADIVLLQSTNTINAVKTKTFDMPNGKLYGGNL